MPKRYKKGLNDKERLFVKHYLISLNQTDAAIKAGYTGVSSGNAGYLLMKKPHISEAIQSELDKRAKKLEITAERIVTEFAKIAFSDMKDYMKWTASSVSLIHSEEINNNQSAAISEISENPGEHGSSIKVKLHDKVRALENLAKYLKLFDGEDPKKETVVFTLKYEPKKPIDGK